MSPNRRIFLNIVATYGRSLYALVIGLFCGRWTLMALGEVEYGLMRVVATTACVEAALLPLTWFFMFDESERQFVRTKLLSRLPVVGEKCRPRRDGRPWI